MINQRRIISQRVEHTPMAVFSVSKPLTGSPVPMISFNYDPNLQSRIDQSQKLSPRTPLQIVNPAALNIGPSHYLRTNYSTIVNCQSRITPQSDQTQCQKEYPQAYYPQTNSPEALYKVRSDEERSECSELIELRLENQILKATNKIYAQKLAQYQSKRSPEKKTLDKIDLNIPSLKIGTQMEMEVRNSKDQPVSISLISNKFMLREMPDMDDVQYFSEMEVQKLKTLKETAQIKQTLSEKQSQLEKFDILIQKSKVNELLLQRKVEALEVLVAVLRLKNSHGIMSLPQNFQENQAQKVIQTLQEYKIMFDQLSLRVDSMIENSRSQEVKIVAYEKKIIQLQQLLIKTHLELERHRQIIPELDQTQFNERI